MRPWWPQVELTPRWARVGHEQVDLAVDGSRLERPRTPWS